MELFDPNLPGVCTFLEFPNSILASHSSMKVWLQLVLHFKSIFHGLNAIFPGRRFNRTLTPPFVRFLAKVWEVCLYPELTRLKVLPGP